MSAANADAKADANADAEAPGVGAGLLATRVLEALAQHEPRTERFKDQFTVRLSANAIVEAIGAARQAGFDQLSDVLGIDWLRYPGHRGPRFSVVYNLYAIEAGERLFLRVDVDEDERVPSITGVWNAANFLEREVFDLFGIGFSGHPNLRKIHTPEDLEGHPLRKDFPLGETPTLFNDGRFLDPAAFRAGMIGASKGLTGWVGGARKGVVSEQVERPPGAGVPGTGDEEGSR